MANLCRTYCFVYKVVYLFSQNFALTAEQHYWLLVLINEKSQLDSISSNFSLSSEYRIETVVWVDQMENQKYCSAIAKLERDTFGQNLVAGLHLRITIIPPIMSPQKRVVFLFEIHREILEQNLLQNC